MLRIIAITIFGLIAFINGALITAGVIAYFRQWREDRRTNITTWSSETIWADLEAAQREASKRDHPASGAPRPLP